MEHLVKFFGRFHPLLVHLPIGSIILAFLFDALSLSKRFRKLRTTVQPALFFGAVSALLSAVTGFCLSQEGGYEKQTLALHQYGGILTALFAFLLLYLRRNRKVLNVERQKQKPVRFFLFVPLIVMLGITGHWGGSLTHGERFITEFSFSGSEEKTDPISKIQSISRLEEAVLYTDIIQPILESKCYSCHSASKQKGDLRLDSPELILRGGKKGVAVHRGLPDSSALFSRMMLPLEDEDHMPPNEKPQPTSAELDLIRVWINDGATFDKKIKDLQAADKIVQFINLLTENLQRKTWIPDAEVPGADETSLQKIRQAGAIIVAAGEKSNYIHINFTNRRTLPVETIKSLHEVKNQVVSLRFSYCNFENTDLKFLNELENLTWLYLDHTNVSDSSFFAVSEVPSLRFLNLVFTSVSEQPFVTEKFPRLEQLFTFQTNFSRNGITAIQQKHPGVKIDSGGATLPGLASDTVWYKKTQ